VNVREASLEVQVRRDTRSYFWALIAVIVKVSSKRSGSDMIAIATAGLSVCEWDLRLVVDVPDIAQSFL
jgi:hypothetical protein